MQQLIERMEIGSVSDLLRALDDDGQDELAWWRTPPLSIRLIVKSLKASTRSALLTADVLTDTENSCGSP